MSSRASWKDEMPIGSHGHAKAAPHVFVRTFDYRGKRWSAKRMLEHIAALRRATLYHFENMPRGSFDRCEALVTKLDADFTAIRRAVTEWMADGI